jgi:hypothetical protein
MPGGVFFEPDFTSILTIFWIHWRSFPVRSWTELPLLKWAWQVTSFLRVLKLQSKQNGLDADEPQFQDPQIHSQPEGIYRQVNWYLSLVWSHRDSRWIGRGETDWIKNNLIGIFVWEDFDHELRGSFSS